MLEPYSKQDSWMTENMDMVLKDMELGEKDWESSVSNSNSYTTTQQNNDFKLLDNTGLIDDVDEMLIPINYNAIKMPLTIATSNNHNNRIHSTTTEPCSIFDEMETPTNYLSTNRFNFDMAAPASTSLTDCNFLADFENINLEVSAATAAYYEGINGDNSPECGKRAFKFNDEFHSSSFPSLSQHHPLWETGGGGGGQDFLSTSFTSGGHDLKQNNNNCKGDLSSSSFKNDIHSSVGLNHRNTSTSTIWDGATCLTPHSLLSQNQHAQSPLESETSFRNAANCSGLGQYDNNGSSYHSNHPVGSGSYTNHNLTNAPFLRPNKGTSVNGSFTNQHPSPGYSPHPVITSQNDPFLAPVSVDDDSMMFDIEIDQQQATVRRQFRTPYGETSPAIIQNSFYPTSNLRCSNNYNTPSLQGAHNKSSYSDIQHGFNFDEANNRRFSESSRSSINTASKIMDTDVLQLLDDIAADIHPNIAQHILLSSADSPIPTTNDPFGTNYTLATRSPLDEDNTRSTGGISNHINGPNHHSIGTLSNSNHNLISHTYPTLFGHHLQAAFASPQSKPNNQHSVISPDSHGLPILPEERRNYTNIPSNRANNNNVARNRHFSIGQSPWETTYSTTNLGVGSPLSMATEETGFDDEVDDSNLSEDEGEDELGSFTDSPHPSFSLFNTSAHSIGRAHNATAIFRHQQPQAAHSAQVLPSSSLSHADFFKHKWHQHPLTGNGVDNNPPSHAHPSSSNPNFTASNLHSTSLISLNNNNRPAVDIAAFMLGADPKFKKKLQNKMAAARYRQKKKDENKLYLEVERELLETNRCLRNRLSCLAHELDMLKQLML